MTMKFLVVFLALLAPLAKSQEKIWAKLEKGNALYLEPHDQKWIPLSDKEQIPTRTFILIKEKSSVSFFKETEAYPLPEKTCCYIEDVLPKSRMEVVSALARIEVAELPSQPIKTEQNSRPIGVAYGEANLTQNADVTIPNFLERQAAVKFFIEQERYDAALLSQKRLMTKFPTTYQTPSQVEILFSLYDKLELYGFLSDETRRLSVIAKSNELNNIILKWSEAAKKKLAQPQ